MKKLQKILERYHKGTATAAEAAFVERYYEHFESVEDFTGSLSKEERLHMEKENWARLLDNIDQQRPARVIPMLTRNWRWAAAAMLVLAAGTYLWVADKNIKKTAEQVTVKEDILPGREGAILTLEDGAQIVLDSLQEGIIATQNGSKIVLKDNSVEYTLDGQSTAAIVYNTLSTPKGRQFHVELPDGTTVWLNAASSIRYPTSFAGKERRVAITGEAYLEVAKNKAKPFIVDVAGKASVEVLGTQFNINAYADEPRLNTTLLEGSIKLINLQETAILKPGQQAQITSEGMKVVEVPDLDLVMAWKRGVFQFNFTRIDEVLRQLSRWYDVEVAYEQKIPDLEFTGVLRRDYNLSQALTILESMGVHFRIDGKKLIVLP